MKIFKLFYQLIAANYVSLLIGFVFLLAITIPINLQQRNAMTNQFVVRKSQITVFNEDQGDPMSQRLVEHLAEAAELVPVENEPEAIADALFNNQTSYILTIPEGFGSALLMDPAEYIPLVKYVVDAQEDAAYVDVLLNTFIQNTRILATHVSNPQDEQQIQQLLNNLDEPLAKKVEIVLSKESSTIHRAESAAFGTYFTHFASYVFMSSFIMAFGYVITSMRQAEIVKRDRMSNIRLSQRATEIMLGCLSFSILYWLALMIAAVFIYGRSALFSTSGLWLMASSFISMFGIQAMAYFFVTLSVNKGMISFMSTFISLFLSFASGLFAPRAFIAQPMQLMASIATPIWQVKADEVIIMASNNLTAANRQEVLTYFGIQFLIACAYYALSFVIQKYRQQTNAALA